MVNTNREDFFSKESTDLGHFPRGQNKENDNGIRNGEVRVFSFFPIQLSIYEKTLPFA